MRRIIETVGSILLYRLRVFFIAFAIIVGISWISQGEDAFSFVNVTLLLSCALAVYGLSMLMQPDGKLERHMRHIQIATGLVVLALSVPLFLFGYQSETKTVQATDAVFEPAFGEYVRSGSAAPKTEDVGQDKLVTYMVDSGHFRPDLVPPEVRAEQAEDVGGMLIIRQKNELIGNYGVSGKGYRIDYEVRFMDVFNNALLAEQTFYGGAPSQYGGSGDSYGSKPTMEDMRAWVMDIWELHIKSVE